MAREYRIDRGGLGRARRTDDGRLIADAYVTRAGVFSYRQPDGSIIREWRPEEEVFRADSLATLEAAVVTHEHPPEMINGENARRYAVGTIQGRPRRDGDRVAAPLVVFDAATVSAMDAGKNQTSCGYNVDLDDTAGVTPEGEKYDRIQRNIRYNHVAVLGKGRAGPSIAVRMDGFAEQVEPDASKNRAAPVAPAVTACHTGETMADKKNKPTAADAKALVERIDAAEARCAELETERDEARSRADQAEAKVEGLEKQLEDANARADAAEAEHPEDRIVELEAQLASSEKARKDAQDPVKFEQAVNARVALIEKARAVMPDEKFDGMSNHDIRVEVCKKLGAPVDPARMDSEDYILGHFDVAVANKLGTDAALARARNIAKEGAANPARADSRTSYQKYADEQQARGTAPLPSAALKGVN